MFPRRHCSVIVTFTRRLRDESRRKHITAYLSQTDRFRFRFRFRISDSGSAPRAKIRWRCVLRFGLMATIRNAAADKPQPIQGVQWWNNRVAYQSRHSLIALTIALTQSRMTVSFQLPIRQGMRLRQPLFQTRTAYKRYHHRHFEPGRRAYS